MLTKVFFPFRRPDLGRYWWHRLAVVAFFAGITTVWIGTWISANIGEVHSYQTCLQFDTANTNGCRTFLPRPGVNFILGTIAAVISSYLLQLIYYRIVLYVVFGSSHD